MKPKFITREIQINNLKRTVMLCAVIAKKECNYRSHFNKIFIIDIINIGCTILNPHLDNHSEDRVKEIAMGKAIKNPICEVTPIMFLKYDKNKLSNKEMDNTFEQVFLHIQRNIELYIKTKEFKK